MIYGFAAKDVARIRQLVSAYEHGRIRVDAPSHLPVGTHQQDSFLGYIGGSIPPGTLGTAVLVDLDGSNPPVQTQETNIPTVPVYNVYNTQLALGVYLLVREPSQGYYIPVGSFGGFWAQLLTPQSGDVYSFQEMHDSNPPNGWVVLPGGVSGILNAEEVNGNAFVQLGTIVWMWPNPEKSGWFAFNAIPKLLTAKSIGGSKVIPTGAYTDLNVISSGGGYDTGNFIPPNPGYFTAPVSGFYFGFWQCNMGGSTVDFGIGTITSGAQQLGQVQGQGEDFQCHWEGELNAGELVWPQVYQNTGGSQTVNLVIATITLKASVVSGGSGGGGGGSNQPLVGANGVTINPNTPIAGTTTIGLGTIDCGTWV